MAGLHNPASGCWPVLLHPTLPLATSLPPLPLLQPEEVSVSVEPTYYKHTNNPLEGAVQFTADTTKQP